MKLINFYTLKNIADIMTVLTTYSVTVSYISFVFLSFFSFIQLCFINYDIDKVCISIDFYLKRPGYPVH